MKLPGIRVAGQLDLQGIVVAEGITGFLGDAVWNGVNSGRTFETVDWTRFKTDDDDEG